MLIAFVTVSTVTVAGVGMLEHQETQMPQEVNAAVGAAIEVENLTVHHRGGDSIPAEEVEVVYRENGVQRFHGPDAVEVVGDGDDVFEAGERWRWTADEPLGGTVDVMLVHASSEAVVDAARLQEPKPDPPVTTTSTDDGTGGSLIAAFTVSDDEPAVDESVTFDASESTDEDGGVVAYEWDLDGDGEWESTGAVENRRFENPGTVDVRLRVTNANGERATTTKRIEVANTDPVADIEASCEAMTCTFTANAEDPDGSVESVEWAFGDGATATGEAVEHEYDAPGTYTVGVTVRDDEGAETTDSSTVEASGGFEFVRGEAVSPHWDGKKTAVQVTLANEGLEDVEIVAIGVSVSKQNIDAVYEDDPRSGPFRAEFYVEATADGYAESGYRTVYDTGARLDLQSDALVGAGDTATMTVAEFGTVKTKCRGWWCWSEFEPRNVPGATVTLEVWLADGSHHEFQFEA